MGGNTGNWEHWEHGATTASRIDAMPRWPAAGSGEPVVTPCSKDAMPLNATLRAAQRALVAM